MPFTCPRCGQASHSPQDARQGYCGACHDWTAAVLAREPAGDWQCPECGIRFLVPPAFPGPVLCGDCERPGHRAYMAQLERVTVVPGPWQFIGAAGSELWFSDAGLRELPDVLLRLAGLSAEVRGEVDPNTLSMLVTSWSQDQGVIAGPAAGDQPEAGDYPWNDAATWHPGYGES